MIFRSNISNVFQRLTLEMSASSWGSCCRYATDLQKDSHPLNDRGNNELKGKFPEAPDESACCGSGCQNCVWIQYSDAVSAYVLENSKVLKHTLKPNETLEEKRTQMIKEQLEKHVPDENLRTYLLMNIPSASINE